LADSTHTTQKIHTNTGISRI